MKIGYFPGCSLHGTAPEYDESLKKVCEKFDIELQEIYDWNCCGATAAHSLNKMLSLALPLRNLALAEQQGLNEILVPCAACYSRLLTSLHEFNYDESVRVTIPQIIELPFSGKLKILNVLDFIEKYIKNELKTKITNQFKHKVACYYGCLLVRPPKLTKFERYEDPLIMEEIVETLGAEAIDWNFKTECCGAGLSVTRTDIVGKLAGKILNNAVEKSAEIIVTACPMCHSNLDMRRSAVNTYLSKKLNIPILYITQLIGLSLGFSEKEMGLDRHFVPFQVRQETINKIQNEKVQEKEVS